MSHHLHMALNTQLWEQEVAVVTPSSLKHFNKQHKSTQVTARGVRTNRGSEQQAALSALNSTIHAKMFKEL